VVQGRDRFCLSLEPDPPLFTSRELGREDLEGHSSVKFGVFGEIDVPHPARSDLLKDSVGSTRAAQELD
jgi:hypothetical protein